MNLHTEVTLTNNSPSNNPALRGNRDAGPIVESRAYYTSSQSRLLKCLNSNCALIILSLSLFFSISNRQSQKQIELPTSKLYKPTGVFLSIVEPWTEVLV